MVRAMVNPSDSMRCGEKTTSQGDRVTYPGGSGIVCERRGAAVRVMPLSPDWPWPLPSVWCDATTVERAPMRYFGEVA